jgi:hypothetical protein
MLCRGLLLVNNHSQQKSTPMNTCPACGEPDGQFLGTAITDTSYNHFRHVRNYCCTRCEYEWDVEYKPSDAMSSDPDFVLPVGAMS